MSQGNPVNPASTAASLAAGFGDPVHDAQRTFRALLRALARPGIPVATGATADAGGLMPSTAAALLALADVDTPVWWQARGDERAAWLRFHNGAPRVVDAALARFAVIDEPAGMPAMDRYAAGSAEEPETSTTLLIEVAAFGVGPQRRWSGPGIKRPIDVGIAGLTPQFWAQWERNHAQFPMGVDVIFCCGELVLGLPRTVHVRAGADAGDRAIEK